MLIKNINFWNRNPDYLPFYEALENLKSRHLPHHPDDPVILHREDIINARRAFKNLRNEKKRHQWDDDLLKVVDEAVFKIVAVVIDKYSLRLAYADAAAHPYHLALGFLLQRFASYLNHVNRVGDVMGESRGGREDRLLKESYSRIFEHGVWHTNMHYFHKNKGASMRRPYARPCGRSTSVKTDYFQYMIFIWDCNYFFTKTMPKPDEFRRIKPKVLNFGINGDMTFL